MAKTWDTRTRLGRAAFDKAVLGKLSEFTPQQRGDVAAKLSAPERWVSASLARLVKAGAAVRQGERNAPRYTKAAAKGG